MIPPPSNAARTSPLKAAIVGVGGLGCPAAWVLARSGVALRLLDEDRVERSNLHRQMLFSAGDVGQHKVVAAARTLSAWAAVEPVAAHVAPDNALALLGGCDVVVEGSDNLATKFLVADACRRLRLPVVHGACVGWLGTVVPVAWGRGACYRCVFEDLPAGDDAPDCATAGVYGPVTSVVGALMAADALALAAGDFERAGAVARYDGWTQRFRATPIARRPGCPLCGDGASPPPLDAARYSPACALDAT
jgi:molybdopterin/thiamine biosynthesis adenylyltransferase